VAKPSVLPAHLPRSRPERRVRPSPPLLSTECIVIYACAERSFFLVFFAALPPRDASRRTVRATAPGCVKAFSRTRAQHGKYQLFYMATAESGGDPTKIKSPTPNPKRRPPNDTPKPLLNHNFFYTTMASINPLLVINTTEGVVSSSGV
jgi:hypothetical protein